MRFTNPNWTNLSFCVATLVGAALGIAAPIGLAQISKDLPPEVAAELAKSPNPPPSNQIVGIKIDRFIGNPIWSPVQVTHGVIFKRSILRQGDPYHAGDPGAVLEHRKDFSLGTVQGNTGTPLAQLPDEQFWY